MARYGSPDDFNKQPTQHADFGMAGYPPPPEPPNHFEAPDPDQPEDEPRPWYRRPVMLIGWALVVVILLALIAYGIVQLLTVDQDTSPKPATTTTTATTTVPSTTTTTTTPPPTTTAVAPTSAPAVQPPAQQPTRTVPRLPQIPTELPNLPPLPTVITIPQVPTVITLPPNIP